MLITGCSHASGSEIDSAQNSEYNKQKSFGNQLARKMGYYPVNIAGQGSTNPTIARSVIEWVTENYNSYEMDLYVLIAWSESSRMEVPCYDRSITYNEFHYSEWHTETDNNFYRINLGYEGYTQSEKKLFPIYHRFMADNLVYLEIYTLNLILQLQYFLNSKNINYTMCNTMQVSSDAVQLKSYINQIDQSKYMDFNDGSLAFWWLYKSLGYVNPLAKYWHHGLEPHTLYAEKLYEFITNPPVT